METDYGGTDEYAGATLGEIESVSETQLEGPEESLQQAARAAESAGKPLLVKVGMHLYDPSRRNYINWRGQAWKASLPGAAAARELRDVLAACFGALQVLGPARLIAVLQRATAEAKAA